MSAIDLLQKFPESILNRDTNSWLGKLWKVISAEFDEIEFQLQALKDIEYIYLATGLNLDRIGELVNQSRASGQTDDTYRLFILVAMAKRLAKGTVPEIIEIGNTVAGLENGGVFIPDSNVESEPATFSIEIQGDIDHFNVPVLLANAIDAIRPAGVYAKILLRFVFTETSGELFTTRRPNFDAGGTFDGLTLLNPQANYAIDEGAIGNQGAIHPPPTNGQLSHELLRKPIEITNLPDGTREYTFHLLYNELNGELLSEILFLSGTRPIFRDQFPDKPKDSSIVYDFKLKETVI
ncbi:hypothetical protein EHQ53_03215 [Leptospira langatensis]|uniref:DUF2612 domain-containing protein n=1 Tax=Leptospira langatensis TaxID=2484983 RepID=A0A5F1ZXK3_9LEPT|nr:hypothetical protein [Leptospira langatensis]TGK04171.1 hypothetical protein EHO57_03445 [Leptospira langatensis]TGL43651.1 hypothetical protein EHQ53_03215 [Leptospira langatensis]